MPQINCRPDGNLLPAPHQIRYHSPLIEGDFEFVSFMYSYRNWNKFILVYQQLFKLNFNLMQFLMKNYDAARNRSDLL